MMVEAGVVEEMAAAIAKDYMTADLDERTRAMLDFAVTERPDLSGPEEVARLRQAGLDDRQMASMLDPAQYRLQVWTAISHGTRGIFLWPDYGLFNPRSADRLAEAALIGCELEVLGVGSSEADERRDPGPVREPEGGSTAVRTRKVATAQRREHSKALSRL